MLRFFAYVYAIIARKHFCRVNILFIKKFNTLIEYQLVVYICLHIFVIVRVFS